MRKYIGDIRFSLSPRWESKRKREKREKRRRYKQNKKKVRKYHKTHEKYLTWAKIKISQNFTIGKTYFLKGIPQNSKISNLFFFFFYEFSSFPYLENRTK